MASSLRITSSEAKGAVIVGGKALGRLVAGLFQEAGESVVLIDTDPEVCKKAAAENIPVFQSSALDPDVLTEAGIESMGTFIALTNNGEVNLVLAQRVKEEFQTPKVLAVFPQSNSTSNNNKIKVNQAFIPELSTETWNKYLNDGEFQLEKIVLREPQISLQQAHLQALIRSGELLPLIIKRDNKLQIVRAVEDWQPADEIFCILHDPRSKLLKRLSGKSQSSRLALDKFPEVEKISVASNKTIPGGAN